MSYKLLTCHYCKRTLRSVFVRINGSAPVCGCAECLLMAARDHAEKVT